MSSSTNFSARVLVADADIVLAEAIGHSLRRLGFSIEHARTAEDIARQLERSHFDVLVFDVTLDASPGRSLLDRTRDMTAPPICFLMAGAPDLAAAVDAVRRGAIDYMAKPIDIATLSLRIERALSTATMRRRLARSNTQTQFTNAPIAASTEMQLAMRLADRVAASPSSSALILGESGVGKEVIATRIHEKSKRRNAPFVRVNMAAMAESMIEAELFGSVKGAFTDSRRDRAGVFASADGGTLLLDEICEFRIEFQAKLLRVLEERRFSPLGSDRQRAVDVRVLAATNRDPREAIERGLLRADLFYRLAPITIEVPPLRQRRSDILPLAERFLASYAQELGAVASSLDEEAKRALLAHDWPGNARELRNTMERAAMLADGPEITRDLLALPKLVEDGRRASGVHHRFERRADVDDRNLEVGEDVSESREQRAERLLSVARGTLSASRQRATANVEREQIERVLAESCGSRQRAAELLGVSRTTLWEKMKRYGLS